MNIGDRIRLLRETKGMTQDELAQKIGYKSRSTIGKIELGKMEITQSSLIQIAKLLDTTPAYLMGWEDKNPSQEDAEILTIAKKIHDLPPENKKIIIDLIDKLSK